MKFNKPILSIEQQISFLKDKGLCIPDHERATKYLKNIGFFRLKAYRKPFYNEDGAKCFVSGTEFDDVLKMYIFDRKLRTLAFDALERIEIAVRNVISDTMCRHKGHHWYIDDSNFKAAPKWHKSFLQQVGHWTGKKPRPNGPRGSSECKRYYELYSSPDLPPACVVIEVLSMSKWSVVYSNLRKTKYKKQISAHFDFDHNDFGSWLHALSLLRNICAHHGVFWNYRMKPIAKSLARYTYKGLEQSLPYTNLCLIHGFLSTFTSSAGWAKNLSEVICECPVDCQKEMSLPVAWSGLPFWRLDTSQ